MFIWNIILYAPKGKNDILYCLRGVEEDTSLFCRVAYAYFLMQVKSFIKIEFEIMLSLVFGSKEFMIEL